MIPLKDDNPTRTVPFVTVALILLNVVVFGWELTRPPDALRQVIQSLGATPAAFTRLHGLVGARPLPVLATLVTAMFLHGGFLHVAGNMLYLWIFGNNIEEVVGHARFVLFYLLCGFTAALVQIVATPASRVPMIGAWFLLQLLSADQVAQGGIAVFAHIGGFVAGLLLIVPFRRKRPRQSLY